MKYRNDLKKRVLAGLFAGAALCLAAPAALAANSPVANNQLPAGGHVVAGDATVPDILKPGGNPNGATSATITQNSQNAVIVWDNGFNVGANATVNFEGPQVGYNTLNYDKGGSMSQIYGTINANNNGNIYIVNPAGVEIGNSAQINVGSLYVSNRNLDNVIDGLNPEKDTNPDISKIMGSGVTTDAALMSLGNINADKVTFDGDRIVIDTERLKNTDGDKKLGADDITILTTNENNVVIGYDAYVNEKDEDGNIIGYKGANSSDVNLAKVNNGYFKKADGYMWVEDVEQLQAIKDNLEGNYALRNSIDATATQDWNDTGTSTDVKEGFQSIGALGNEFTGKFDGLDYNIFNLNIKKDTDNVGLFGVVGEGAVINNVTLVGGSITGQNNVGALAGSVQGGAHISNITNSASVTGASNVGGIVGASVGTEEHRTVYDSLINTGTITSSGADDKKGGYISNAGGLIGYLKQGDLGGTSYNLGAVTGRTENDGSMIVGYNVGGLVGHAVNSVIGNEDMIDEGGNVIAEGTTVYNRLNVTGAYNVGGIVGQMEGTKVYNAENSGNISTAGSTSETYVYHTADKTYDKMNGAKEDGIAQVDVLVSNVGGIAGSASDNSTITNVLNTGNVNSSIQEKNVYEAGNVGGIVGRAEDTNISNATNRENEIRGAHNVGGIAGYFSGSGDNADKKYTIEKATNDGGDIMATGARAVADGTHNNAATTPADDNVFYGYNVSNTGYALEHVRNENTGRETVIIGNMGGIVGYMDGDDVYIKSSANRGTVHSQEFTGMAPDFSKAANVGGIAGKIDRSSTKDADTVKGDYTSAAVSNSYNTGDVRGYMGVGGIAGMMYNGEIVGSYNLGTVNTTRQPASSNASAYETVNMGGIVGDTTEGTRASALLYDVYNKGQIGDEEYKYYARHVGGIVGRLSGTVEKAYNTGAIYNGYNVVGGIAGWIYEGSIKNAFNTGNITVVNQNNATSQVGGIAGAASTNVGVTLENVYNLGTIRSFRNTGAGNNTVGGILGIANGTGKGKVSITNAYTTGNIWAGDQNVDNSYSEDKSNFVRSIWGRKEGSAGDVQIENTYYIRPDTGLPFKDLSDIGRDNSDKAIEFANKSDASQYEFGFTTETNGAISRDENGNVTEDWRIYEGSTPILNAFLPNTEGYFSENGLQDSVGNTGFDVQYGTAYDPLLTIINAAKGTNELTFNWQELGANNAAGIAVYGAGLKLTDFKATGGSGYYAGLLYADGALSISADGDAAFSSAAELYGSSVTIDAKGDVTIYGDVTATGNTKDGTTVKEDGTYDELENFKTDGSITITGGSVDIYGQLTSAKKDGEPVRVPGINGMAEGWDPSAIKDEDGKPIENAHENPNIAMSDIGDRFGYTTSGSAVDGDITIIANDASDGHVNVYYGNQKEGFIDAAGSLSVTAAGDIYMDSDLKVGGDLTLTSPGEMVLNLTNIGQVQADKGLVTDALTGLHDFMHQFETGGNTISFQTGTSDGTAADAKLAVDMWNDEENAYDLGKYDTNGHTFKDELDQLNFTVQGDETASAAKYTYIWVSTGEQLAGIQQAADTNPDFLGYNFALKNDIDVSGVTDYEAIGTGSADGYTGTFDGRDNRIIGLDTTKKAGGTTQTLTNAGIFDTIGAGGKVEDLRVYAGTFSGTDNAGAVAGVNNGTISNVTAFGNVVDVQNTSNGASYAGGIAGTNRGTIDNVTVTGTATQSSEVTAGSAEAAAGGIAGLNDSKISNSTANSAVNSSAGDATALGGVAGVNAGTLTNVDSLGVTTGVYKVEGKDTLYSDNVGGIAGTNSGTVENAYNESIVSGRDNVGGILGENSGKNVSNVANASRVTGEANPNAAEDGDKTSDYVGGLVGDNEGRITNGRNNGEITGNNYVGGLVGANRVGADNKKPELTNLVNDSAAAITGDNYVGGIAGSNAGTISADEGNDNLINRGTITGVQYVGGVAGENTGTITNTNNDVDLHVKEGANDAKYFGGVAGINTDTGTITDATNHADVSADGASYVGGVVGKNDGTLEGMNGNYGNVTGKDFVGGVAGENTQALSGVNAVNQGNVKASDGGAGGIFAVNRGEIHDSTFSSEGEVSGTTGDGTSGTGGIFGVNVKDIVNSVLENKGYTDKDGKFHSSIVTGTSNTGGLIGINTGDVSTSSLKNEANITVTAGDGQTVENISGLIGKNTGTITGGQDANDSGYYKYQIYNNGTITVTGKGENIGGLIGNNAQGNDKTGSLTAGYNTGVIHADGSENVGGIAGTNAGTLNQVFNTVITVNEDGSTASGSITGSTNVGGIAGTNSGTGTISNAYNTTGVTGTAEDAVTGFIAGTNSNTAGDSISNVYSTIDDKLVNSDNLVGSGTVSNVYDSEQDAFGDDDSSIHKDGEEAAENDLWRQYGDNNPILKVFLTQLTVNETAVIDGKEISLNDYLNLVYNGKEQDINIQDLIDKGFITGPEGMKDADENSFAFNAYENTSRGPEESNPFGNSDLLYNTDGQKYAGSYENWLASEQIEAGGGTVNNLGYDIDFGALSEGNEINIGKAQIQIDLDTINRVYGNAAIQGTKPAETNGMHFGDDKDYGFTISNDDTRTGLTEGMLKDFENLTMDDLGYEFVSDGALGTGESGKVTNNAGDHTWSANFSLGEDTGETSLAHNYELVGASDQGTVQASGTSHVDRAHLTISANDEQIYVSERPQFSGTVDTFVNGDSFQIHFGTEDVDLSNRDVVGFWFNGKFYGTQDAVNTETDLFGGNYNVKFTPGTLTVQDLPEGMPEISDIPSIERHWNFLFDDNPWDRNRDFRERKAEVHFVAGGMTL